MQQDQKDQNMLVFRPFAGNISNFMDVMQHKIFEKHSLSSLYP